MNTIHLSGNLTADIETFVVNQENSVDKFTIACNQGDRVLYFPVEAWNKNHLKNYLRKGSRVFVTGYLKQESWKSKTGENRHRHLMVANTVEFGDQPPRATPQQQDKSMLKNENFRQQPPTNQQNRTPKSRVQYNNT